MVQATVIGAMTIIHSMRRMLCFTLQQRED
jgi:hypothetical protein